MTYRSISEYQNTTMEKSPGFQQRSPAPLTFSFPTTSHSASSTTTRNHEFWLGTLGSLLHPFMALHNFTFHLAPHHIYFEGSSMTIQTVSIAMQGSLVVIAALEDSYMSPLSLQYYGHWRTLYFTNTTAFAPFELSKLMAPFLIARQR